MDTQTIDIISGFMVIATVLIAIIIIKGAIKTFQRNWIAALILLLFLPPIWIIWAFIEMFTPAIVAGASSAQNQSMNVTLVNQVEDETKECPFCAEKVRKNAVVCRFCNRDL